jgi:hypothetical protein
VADYNANIKVNADTRAAEQALKRLTTEFDKLKGVKNIGEAFVPKQALTRLEKSLNTVVNRANTVEKAFARVVEGVGTLGVSGAALGGLNEALKSVATATGQSAANFSGAAQKIDEFAAAGDTLKTTLAQVNNLLVDVSHEIARGVVPGFSIMDDTAQATAQTANKLQYAFQQFLDSSEGIRTFVNNIGTLEGTSGAAAVALTALAAVVEGQLSEALYDIDTSASTALQNLAADASKGASELQRLIRATQGTVEQYEALISKGQERIRTVNAESNEARRAANTITQGQKLLNAELERQNDLLREARGLRPASVEKRATDRYNLFQRRKEYTKTVADEFTAVDESIARIAQQPTDFTRALGLDSAEDKLRRFNAELDAVHEALEQMETRGALNPFGITAQQIEIADHNAKQFASDIELVNKQLTEMLQVHQALGRMESARPSGLENGQPDPFGVNLEQVYEARYAEEKAFEDLRLDTIRQAINAELDGIDEVYNARTKANKAALDDFDRRLTGRGEAKKRRRQVAENVAIGGAFPLLFGGGPGAVLGGAAGGFIPGSPMLSVVTSALGTVFDQYVQGVTETGKALRYPIESFKELAEKGLLASKSQEKYIEKLIEAGRVYEAAGIIQDEVIKKIGVQGVKDLQNAGAASDKLNKAMAELAIQTQAAVAGPLAAFLSWLAEVVAIGNNARRAEAAAADLVPQDPAQRKKFESALITEFNRAYGGSSTKLTRGSISETLKYMSMDQRGRAGLQRLQMQFQPQTAPGLNVDPTAAQRAAAQTQELQKQVDLAGKQLSLVGLTLEKDGARYIAAAKAVAQQEYDNKLLEIKNSWIGKIFDKEKNLAMIKKANLELAAKNKQIDVEITQNAEMREKAALSAEAALYQQAERILLFAVKAEEFRAGEEASLTEQLNLHQLIGNQREAALEVERTLALQEAAKNGTTQQVVTLYELKRALLKDELDLEKAITQTRKDRLVLDRAIAQADALREAAAPFTELQRSRALEQQYAKTYLRLVTEGLLPAEAERIANFEKLVAEQLAYTDQQIGAVEQQILLTEATITEADARGVAVDKLKEQLDLLKQQRGVIEGRAAAGPGEGLTDRQLLETAIADVRGQLNELINPANQVVAAADAIGTAFADSFKGIISGAMTAQQALASFFQSVADSFLDMAAQIIAKWIQMTILNTVLSLFPGGGGGGGGTTLNMPNGIGDSYKGLMNFADGGNPPVNRPSIVGEKGPELFVPRSSGTIIPNNKLGMGDANIVVNVDASGSKAEGDAGQANKLGEAIGLAVKQELIKQKRPGGLLA